MEKEPYSDNDLEIENVSYFESKLKTKGLLEGSMEQVEEVKNFKEELERISEESEIQELSRLAEMMDAGQPMFETKLFGMHPITDQSGEEYVLGMEHAVNGYWMYEKKYHPGKNDWFRDRKIIFVLPE